MKIKELKKRGLQLRAIKDLVPQLIQLPPGVLKGEIQQAVETAQEAAVPQEDTAGWTGMGEEKILEFQAILERLITQEIQSKNEEEERCRSLDLAIRRQQLARREAAAASEKKQTRRLRNT